jgi:uncharacterized RDD family membrane protein YckC
MRLAGPISRFLAWLIDACCVWLALLVISWLLRLIAAVSQQLGLAMYLCANFVISVGYGIVLEWLWRGQTLGKRLLRLRVIDEQGLRLKFSQVVLRNLLRAVDSLPLCYLIGGLTCLANPRGQRLGDIAACTVVVRNPETWKPSLEKLLADKFNSLREQPHMASRLRHKVSPEEAFLVLRALLRRDELDAAARVELFSDMAAHFKSLVKFPQSAQDGVTDESYLRNVADVLFRRAP